MNRNKLTYGMAFFFLISFTLLGFIVVEEKKVDIMMPKVEKKIDTYLKEHYVSIKTELKKEKLIYDEKNKKFIQKITNHQNKNLYFYLSYQKKKIISTYKEDYQYGKTLLTHIEKNLEEQINDKTIKVKINTPLNKMSQEVKEQLLKEKNLKNLKIYTIEKDLKVDFFTLPYILQAINQLSIEHKANQISPKNYTLTITNRSDITQSIKIENLILPNNYIKEIITGVLTNDKTTETKYNIKYSYLN